MAAERGKSISNPTTAPDEEAWHRALQAGMQAQRDFRANRDNPEWDSDWDDEAEDILEAVWPHIAAYEQVEERDRIRRLAELHKPTYWEPTALHGPGWKFFADLLEGDTHD